MDEGSKPNSNGRTPRLIEIDAMGENPSEETLYTALHRLFSPVFFPDPETSPPKYFFQRLRRALAENGPSLKQASRNSTVNLLLWTRRGTPLRSLFVISVGTITFLALTGLLVFMLFFLAATANAIIISFLMSLAAAGGFFAIFFTCMTAVYIAALSVAVFVISTATISTIIAVAVATGNCMLAMVIRILPHGKSPQKFRLTSWWIGFFWTLWLAAKKGIDLTKHSLSMTGSALSAYSAARHRRPEKVVD